MWLCGSAMFGYGGDLMLWKGKYDGISGCYRDRLRIADCVLRRFFFVFV